MSESKFEELNRDKRIWWGKDGNSIPQIKRFLSEVKAGRVPQTLWLYRDVGHTDESKKELKDILNWESSDDVFITPKPTRLLQRVLEIATEKESIILDSFAGSGATAHAVLAMNNKDGGNRKFILIECEDYADTLTAERVRRVIKGYKYEGTQREELLRESLTWTKLKKAGDLVAKVDGLEQFEKKNYDRITKTVDDGELVVIGETKVTEKVEGLGGSFTFATLGPEMSLDKLLGEGLPTFEALAKYVFFTATGQTLVDLKARRPLGFIGETGVYRVHLLYQPDSKWLASNEAALSDALVEKLVAANTERKRLLVFAAAKFMSQRELTRQGVEFCQLPFSIHRLLGE